MLGTYFYHETTRKIIAAFGTFFNDIDVVRRESNGTEIERVKVPLSFSPKQRWLEKVHEDSLIGRQSIVLPAIGYELTSLEYDAQRKVAEINKQVSTKDDDEYRVVFSPVPYNLNFSVYIGTTNLQDMYQIVEQIIPYFTPDFTIKMSIIPSMSIQDDIPVVLQSVGQDDNFEGNLEDGTTRRIFWTLNFVVKAKYYGPVSESGIIRTVQIDFGTPLTTAPADLAVTPRVARVVVTPNPSDAEPDEEYTYTVTTTEFDDGKKYNPVTDQDEDIS